MKKLNVYIKLLLTATAVLLVLCLVGCNVVIPGIEIPTGTDNPTAGAGTGNSDGAEDKPGTDTTPDGTDTVGGTEDTDADSGTQAGGKDEADDPDAYDPSVGTDSHTCRYESVLYVAPSCETDGREEFRCSCGKERTDILPASHTPDTVQGKAATCREAGYTESVVCGECGEVITASTELPILPHTEVTDPAVPATETAPAITEGKHCSVCGYVIVKQQYVFSNEYSTPENYDGSYAYESLLMKDNGAKLAELYMRIDEQADIFHSSGESIASGANFIVAAVTYSDLGISSDDALAVWSAYRADHPLYYWISSSLSYSTSAINLYAYEEYADGEVRNSYNARIYEKVEELVSSVSSASSYMTTLAFHDYIISNAAYAYESDGVTPSDDPYAHNIIGVLDTGAGVCESYAKAFQLLLNFCGIENIFVSGNAGGPHAWNLVRLDDGEWYWYDLTWDDTPDFMWGISYRYFCVTDDADLSGSDGPWISGAESFAVSHVPYSGIDTGIDYTYALPSRSETDFTAADALLRDTFTVSGLTYAISGYGTAQLTSVGNAAEIIIPETVEYLGATYSVTSVGIIKDGFFKTGSIAYDYAAEKDNFGTEYIKIPKSVVFIWDDALNIDTLANIEVDAENAYFTSVDGVLFTKDMYTLIKYPSAKAGTSYTLPDETVQIAAGAFSKFYSNLNLSLTSITLGENTSTAGAANYGYGYTSTYEHGNFVDGEWNNIRSYLSGLAVIYRKNGQILI